MADEEALPVVIGVDKPAGDIIGRRVADLSGGRVVDVDALDLDGELVALYLTSTSGSPKTMNRLPAPVFFKSDSLPVPIKRSRFIRAAKTVSLP